MNIFDSLKLPQWLRFLAFCVATFYFIAKVVLLILWFFSPESNPRLEPTVGLFDVGFGITWFVATIGLSRSGDFKQFAKWLDIRIRGHVTKEHEKTRQLFTQEKYRIPVYVDGYQSEKHREADLKLLIKLWQYINTKNVNLILEGILHQNLDSKSYDNFRAYLIFREEHPEADFIGDPMRNVFSEFDEILVAFDHQLFQSAGFDLFGETRVIRPDYRLENLRSQEIEDMKRQQWDHTLELRNKVKEEHSKLVIEIKRHFPEFEFDVPTRDYQTEKHREADMKLLSSIWRTLNSDNFARFAYKIEQRSATFADYEQFDKYLENRQTLQWMKFHNDDTESALRKFDESFIAFNKQYWQSHGRDERNSDRIQSDYKQRGLSRSERKSAEDDRDKAIDRLYELKEDHANLIQTLTNYFPEFDFSTNSYQSEEQREADKRLLHKLLEYIDNNTLTNLYHHVYNRTLRYDYYNKYIEEYQQLRQSAENQFINSELEVIFIEFDQLLAQFDNQLSLHSDLIDRGSTQLFVPHYKLPEVKPDFRFQSDEIRQEKIKQHQIDVQLAKELRQKHSEMIGKVKRILPDAF